MVNQRMKVLIAVEDEFFGNCIFNFLRTLGWIKNAQIRLVHIVEPLLVDNYMSFAPAPVLTDVVKIHLERGKVLLDKLEADILSSLEGGTVEKAVYEDFAKTAILDDAKNWGADLIIVGSHGRKGFSKFFLGSVSQAVCGHADRPVLVVRPTQEALAGKSSDVAQ